VWKSSGVQDKWESSAWAKKRATQEKRRNLTDFERFKVQILKAERRKSVGKGKSIR
jgi:large subunit ribosomal protein L14e